MNETDKDTGGHLSKWIADQAGMDNESDALAVKQYEWLLACIRDFMYRVTAKTEQDLRKALRGADGE